MSEKERQLIKGCMEGDKASQKQLYLEYGPAIRGICLRYAASPEEAEDLFHDTFLFILVNFRRFENITSLQAWLRRIAVNKAIDHYRKCRRTRQLPIEDLTCEPAAIDNKTGEETLSMDKLVSFINELPDKYRIAFNLYVIDGMDYDDIVAKMGETPTNARTLVFRARNILQQKIRRYLNHEEYDI